MPLSTQPYKGARDFYPEDKRLQKYIFSIMRTVAEKYGYEEYDAPILEPTELFATKTSDEIVNEQTYTFVDRGERSVTIRTEMTPSVSRMVAAKSQELAYPLRWYSIPNLWRYERPQRGRLREFWQFNVDIFGISDVVAEHEVIQLANATLEAFGAKRDMYVIKLNSRLLVSSFLLEQLHLDETQVDTLMHLIDRMHKLEPAEFNGLIDAIFNPTQRESGVHERLRTFLKVTTLDDLPAELLQHPSVIKLKTLQNLLYKSGITNTVFDVTLMRGFEYYSDIVFEVFDSHPENNRSMFGGGRYDNLMTVFGAEPIPTVGFGMGDVTMQNFLEVHGLLPSLKTETDLYIALIGDVYERSLAVIEDLREMGINIAIDMSNRKPDKQLKTALKKGINYILFIGENELAEDQYTLKNLHTGKEERHSAARIVSIIKDFRHE